MFKPEMRVSESYESNYLHVDSNEQDTFITELAPALVIESDFSRHALRVTTYGAFGFYTNDSDDDYVDYGTQLDGVIDVTRDHRFVVRGTYRRDHEKRGGDEVPTAAKEPVEFNEFDLNLAGDLNFGRFRFEPFVFGRDLDYHDITLNNGLRNNQDDRDRVEFGGGLEVGYAVRSGYEAFIRGEFKTVDYEATLNDAGLERNRDSDGFRVLGGLKVDLTRLIEASVGLGYEERDFDDPFFQDFSGVSASGRARWDITQRTSLFAKVEREVAETTVGDASSKVDFGGSLGVEHELLRTLGVYAGAGYFDRDFKGISRNDDILFARVGAEWDVARFAALNVEYEFEHRNSNVTTLDFDNHTVLLSVRFFY